MHKLLTTTLSILFFSISLFAQKFSIGAFVGGSNYQGDVVQSHLMINETQLAYGGFVRYNVSPKIEFKGNVYAGTLTGNDKNFASRIDRGLYFRTSILEGGVNVEWNILGGMRYNKNNMYTPVRTPYIFTGIGAVLINPKVYGLPDNSPDLTADIKKFQFMVPIGIGYKYDLTPKIQMNVEIASHLPFTDYLDGVSLSGKPDNNDWYVFGGFGVSYAFGGQGRKSGIDAVNIFK